MGGNKCKQTLADFVYWNVRNFLLCPLLSTDGTMELFYDSEFTCDFSMQMKEISQKLFGVC